jgi:hypothetical protein
VAYHGGLSRSCIQFTSITANNLQPICVVAKGTDDVITEKKKKIDAAAVKTVNRMKPFPIGSSTAI